MKRFKKIRVRLHKLAKSVFKVTKLPEMKILPGQLAFFLLLSVIPMVALIGALMSIFGATGNVLQEAFVNIIPDYVIDFFSSSSTLTMSSKLNYFIFFISAFVLASNGTSSLIIASNSIYHIKDAGFIERRVKSLVMMIILIALMFFVILVPALGDFIAQICRTIFDDNSLVDTIYTIYRVLQIPLSLFLIFFNIKLLYTLAPDTSIRSRDTTFGAMFTAIGWFLSSKVYSFYIVHFSHYNMFYGGLSNLLILLLWFYLLAYILVLGMALNASGIWHQVNGDEITIS